MKIKTVGIAFVGVLATVGTVMAQTDWTVGFDRPPAVGVQVGHGEHSNKTDPDLRWQAPDDGLVQVVYFDHDSKCDEEAGYIRFEKDNQILANYPVPTAAWVEGKDCWNPIDNLYASRIFTVEAGTFVDADQGETSGWFDLEHATYTPTPPASSTPTATPTATPLPTNTPLPPATATYTPTPVPTPTPWPTIVGTPPTPLAICLSVSVVPPLPTAIPADGFVADLYVDAVNAEMYVLYDNDTPVVTSAQQPLTGITFLPNHVYSVSIADEAAPCKLGSVPTGLEVEPQPQNGIYLPAISNGG